MFNEPKLNNKKRNNIINALSYSKLDYQKNESLIAKYNPKNYEINKKCFSPIKSNINSPKYKKNQLSTNKSSTKDKTNDRGSLIKSSKKYLLKVSTCGIKNMNYKNTSLISSFSKNVSIMNSKAYKTRNKINNFSINKNKLDKNSSNIISSTIMNNSTHNTISLINKTFVNNKIIKIILNKYSFNDKKRINNQKMNSIKKCEIILNNQKQNKTKSLNKILLNKKNPKKVNKNGRNTVELTDIKNHINKTFQNNLQKSKKKKLDINNYKIQDFSFKKNNKFFIINMKKINIKYSINDAIKKIKLIKNKKSNKILALNPINLFKKEEEEKKIDNDYDTPHFTTFIEA